MAFPPVVGCRLARAASTSIECSIIADLRSDTMTLPSDTMLHAMARARLGDDVWQEDPTVRRLEAHAADLLGKERAIFVPSGTMANSIAIACHTRRGDALLAGDMSHIVNYEQGGAAALWSVTATAVPNLPDGTMHLTDLDRAINPDDPHYARTAMVALELTHNNCGGSSPPLAFIDGVGKLCSSRQLKLHVDGARLLNAAVSHNTSPARLLRCADSSTLCLSKGLGCPVGSVLAADATMIEAAQRIRKLLGGGMRQAGVLAAAGLVALGADPSPTRSAATLDDRDDSAWREPLQLDHAHTALLARGLAEAGRGALYVVSDATAHAGLSGRTSNADEAEAVVQTNIVYFDYVPENAARQPPPLDLEAELAKRGVLLASGYTPSGGGEEQRFRAVLHRGVTREAVHATIDAVAEVFGCPS